MQHKARALTGDPTNFGRRITTGVAEAITTRHALDEAARLSRLAREATEADDRATAVRHLLRLFKSDT